MLVRRSGLERPCYFRRLSRGWLGAGRRRGEDLSQPSVPDYRPATDDLPGRPPASPAVRRSNSTTTARSNLRMTGKSLSGTRSSRVCRSPRSMLTASRSPGHTIPHAGSRIPNASRPSHPETGSFRPYEPRNLSENRSPHRGESPREGPLHRRFSGASPHRCPPSASGQGNGPPPELPVWHLGVIGSLHRRDIYDDVG